MKTRNPNMELFRIVLMIGIVFGHGLRFGVGQDSLVFPSFPYFSAAVLDIIATPAVNCFVMLSGYFLIIADFKISRILKLWMQILFYSIVLHFVLAAIGFVPLDLKNTVLSFVPLISNCYWFATNYVALYLLFPFINRALRNLDRRPYQVLIAVELILFSLVSMIPGVSGFNSLGGNSLIWFMVLYTLGAYLRCYPCAFSKQKLLFRYAAMILLMFLLSEAVMLATQKITGLRQAGARITGYTSIMCVFTCVLLFRVFERLSINERAGKIINRISQLCFGVYLIHEHPDVRSSLWNTIGLGQYADQWWLAIGLFLEAILVFFACCIVEYGRKKLFDLIPGKIWTQADKKFASIIQCGI